MADERANNGLLIQNGLLILRRGEECVSQRGDILVRGGRIAAIHLDGSAPSDPGVRVLDATDKLVMPGLINAHTHSYANLYKTPAANAPVEVWIPYPARRRSRMSEQAVYTSVLLGCIELLLSGTTTVLDHFAPAPHGLEPAARAYLDAGIRTVIAPQVSDRVFSDTLPGQEGASHDQLRALLPEDPPPSVETLVAACRDFTETWDGRKGRLHVMMGPSAPHRCSDDLLHGLRDIAEDFQLGIHTHLLETKVQTLTSRELYGGSTVNYLDQMKLVSPRTSFAHAIWLSDHEIQLLAERGASIIHNPYSNLLLGSGIAPILKMRQVGVNVALGTDGPNCSGNQNLFQSMKLAASLPRVLEPDYRLWLQPATVFDMATRGGARALLMDQEIGSLEVGYRADLVLLNLNSPSLVPLEDVISQLVLFEDGRSVDTVLVEGRVVVQDGHVTTVDAATVYAEAQRLASEGSAEWRVIAGSVQEAEGYLRSIYEAALGA